MSRLNRREMIGRLTAAMGAVFFHPWHTYRRPVVDLPISLAKGTVKTAPFALKNEDYRIMIQVKKTLPFASLMCMLGITLGPGDKYNCDRAPLLQLDWTLWDGKRVAASGGLHHPGAGADFLNHYILRHLGLVVTQPGKDYVLEVNFTQDASALDVTHPRLVVVLVKESDW